MLMVVAVMVVAVAVAVVGSWTGNLHITSGVHNVGCCVYRGACKTGRCEDNERQSSKSSQGLPAMAPFLNAFAFLYP